MVKVVYGFLLFSGYFSLCYANTSPVCPSMFNSVMIPEDTAVDTSLFVLTCDDSDTGVDGSLTYVIASGNDVRKFNLVLTGTTATIKSARPFDLDDKAEKLKYILQIDVTDRGTPPLKVSVTLDITLTPVNEFDPQFMSMPPSLVLNEDTPVGTMIHDTKPYDQDLNEQREGQKTKVTLSSTSSYNIFFVDELTGKIFLRQPLDFESVSAHHLELKITDVGQPPDRSVIVPLNITVHNVNENPPICSAQIYNINIKETEKPGTNLLQLDCKDLETPHLAYKLHRGDASKFQVETHGEIKLKESIDTDTEENFWSIQVEVRDHGAPRLETFVHVNFFVEDVDDNVPYWHPANNGTFTVSIPENSAVGTYITTLTAVDKDRKGSEHDIVKYAIEDTTTEFTIEPLSGKILIASPNLDREDKNAYKLGISASSSNKPTEKILGEVNIFITDENDNSPIFSKELYSATWPEDTPTSTVLLTVHATDKDDGKNGKIQYVIRDGNMEDGCRVSIHKSSGRISTDSTLDYERKPSCFLTVVASDDGDVPLVSTSTVVISVEGVNEYEPVFGRPSFSASIMEDTPIGSSIIQVEANDDDHGLDGQIKYSIGTHSDMFTVDPENGIVKLLKELDTETEDSYLVEIIATDNSLGETKSATTTLTLTIDDVNEAAPICQPVVSVNLLSPIKVGDLVHELKCSDSDMGSNGILSYNIDKGNTNTAFGVDSQGHLVVKKVPDRPLYDLEITVFDGGVPQKTTTVFVHIKVNGEPEFQNMPATVELIETTQIGTVVYTAKSKSPHNNHRFSIVSGNTNNVFGINDISGDVYIVSSLDREKVSSYRLSLELLDIILKLSTTEILTVNVADTNDEVPRFTNSFYEFSVVENVPLTSTVGRVNAKDDDIGNNAVIIYKIESGNVGSTFFINDKGEIILDRALDAETVMEYHLGVIASDKGDQPLTGSTVVNIKVIDYDEFPINFETGAHYSYTLSEDSALGEFLFKVRAKDNDRNTIMEYLISDGNDGSFILDKQTGEIFLGKHVDRERIPEYNLTVIANNGLGDSTSLDLNIEIADVNDNEPHCSEKLKSVSVDENEPIGSTVASLHCSDDDLGVNSRLMYSIISGNTNDAFRLNGNNVETNRQLDYETTNYYTISVEITDQGLPQRSSSVVLAISVKPNYKQPKLYKSSDHIETSEATQAGTVLYDIDATLDGATEGDWNIPGDLEYHLQTSSGARDFSVDVNTGEVSVSGSLNREQTDLYILQIKCINRNNRNLYEVMTLNIKILDENDNAPTFKNAAYIFSVEEDAKKYSFVGKVEASDADLNENAEVEYSLISGEEVDSFKINDTSGVITVNNSLNASLRKEYFLVAAVYDNGIPQHTSTTRITIHVIDINNHVPQFQHRNSNIDISEAVDIDDVVFIAKAIDYDTGKNGKVKYAIESGNDMIKFKIDEDSGKISIADELDRESLDLYNLEIIAQDDGVPTRTSTSTLHINVIDVNDNKPIFSRLIYDVNVDRFITAGASVVKTLATDRDIDENARIDYFITSGNDENYFLINITTGEIQTVAPLSAAPDYHELQIKAADNGYPRLTSFAKVHIAIHPSIINTGTHFQFFVFEDAEVGTLVGTVVPDNIHSKDSKPMFTIVGGDPYEEFMVDRTTGILRTEEYLDRETLHEYFLTIKIEDQTNKTAYHKLVHVIIEDINDNTPMFHIPYNAITVVENSPKGLSVLHLSITDDDIDENANVTLLIDPSDPLAHALFEVDTLNNDIILKIEPDYEMISDLSFRVFAIDAGIPSRTGTAEVVVTILDVKDTKPYDDLPASYFSLEVPINAKNGDVLTTFTPHNFGIYQALTDPIRFLTMNRGGVFDVDADTGDLFVQNQMSLYKDTRYIMWAVAQVSRNATWNGAAGIIRVDSLIPNIHMVVIEHGVSPGILQSQKNKLKYALQDLFPMENRVGVWKIIGDSEVLGRRRLLATGSRSFVYVVRDRSTDTLQGIENEKKFLSKEEILKVLQQSSDGTPARPLYGKAFDTFPVSSVKPHYVPDPPEPAWHQTKEGIAVLLTIFLSLLLLAIVLVLYFYCTRHGPKRSHEFSKIVVKEKDAVREDQYHVIAPNQHYIRRSPAFKPWNASCTSINGSDTEYYRNPDDWNDVLHTDGVGLHGFRKPTAPPPRYDHPFEVKEHKIRPWLFKFRENKFDGVNYQDRSLTSYKTKVERLN